ncbi:ankyrin repeat domain-containing protein 27 isoform X2 [Octopus bimaculoides]|uniref:VPS9 domain-containing protein n=1 Tax=Octopus bimaculoides TaxID=37653 RepID=A0A0L8GLD3_OCTBM|nr:ankyrin repeat domain-containing protein 27 isoform X2 [Octopus bimaculoides]|eukprot:XP_014780066.1 PREDICTED: ankyrin repeat domain-containing protein 27-like isoform X2 [Octopus bimaculoides]
MEKYDEDLLDNPFFTALQNQHSALFDTVTTCRYTVCVPRHGAARTANLNEAEFEDHILIPTENEEGQNGHQLQRTVSGKTVYISNGQIHLQDNFANKLKINILFEETFYNAADESYRVLCVEQIFNSDLSKSESTQQFYRTPTTYKDCIELLWGDSTNRKTRENLDKVLQQFIYVYERLDVYNFRSIVDVASAQYTKSMQLLLRDPTLKSRARHNPVYMDCLKVAAETYVLHQLHKSLFGALTLCMASDDAEINKCTRNLKELQCHHLDIRESFINNIPIARKEIARLNKYSTPMGKLYCIQRLIAFLMRSPKSPASTPEGDSEALSDVMTSDDLLPLLIFIIVKSEIPNWCSNLAYVQHFNFSRASNKDEYSYYLATIEAALEQIRSGKVKIIPSTSSNIQWFDSSVDVVIGDTTNTVPSPIFESNKTPELSPTDIFFQHIEGGDENAVKVFLNRQNEMADQARRKLCHPLCSCDKCETLMRETRRDSSLVTPSTRDDRGYTALHVAAAAGHAELIDILVYHGASVDATDYMGLTPMHLACQKGFQSVTLLLVHFGCNLHLTDNDGNTPLHSCAANGHEECVKALVFSDCGNGKLNIDAVNDAGDTALHLAAKWGYENIVETLIENNARTDIRNRKKQFPMNCAHNTHIQQLLLSAPTDEMRQSYYAGRYSPERKTVPLYSSSIATSSVSSSNLYVEQSQTAINSKYRQQEKLFKAIKNHDVQLVRFYLGLSSDSENKLKTQQSLDSAMGIENLCHPLCQCEKCAVLQQKLAKKQNDIDVNKHNCQGLTALHLAVQGNSLELAKTMLEAGAHINSLSEDGFTPLHLACMNDDIEMVELLLSYGAKVNLADHCGNSPLHHSCHRANIPLATMLLEHGARVNQRNHIGSTCLHEAVGTNNANLVALLLEAGANISLVNLLNLSPVHLAENQSIKHLLVSFLNTKEPQGSEAIF